jgi:long-chain acyl-CoA synthetase
VGEPTSAVAAPFSPAAHAASSPDRAAVIMGRSGVVLTYQELDDRSNRLAQLFRSLSLVHGDHIAIHKDQDKTRASRNQDGWSTLWDMGYLDDEGYLYLTDRTAFMIISAGVNIYPQEIENVLVTHPKVMDVAVIGVPNEEFGEEVKAVIQPVTMDAAGPELADELLEYSRGQLAGYKCPRSIDFVPELPRLPTGKLYKRLLREQYWAGQEKRI